MRMASRYIELSEAALTEHSESAAQVYAALAVATAILQHTSGAREWEWMNA